MTKKIKSLFIAFLIIASFILSVWFFTLEFGTEAQSNSNFYDSIRELELADSEKERTTGLMFREDICDGCGMLFDFKEERSASFWMKDTPTSLDIIFIKADGRIDSIHTKTIPNKTYPTYDSQTQIRYVLEMKAGFSEENDLKVGMMLDMDKIKSKIVESKNSLGSL